MSGFRFGASSAKKLNAVHPDLVKVAYRAIELSPYDFGVTEGSRTLAQQQEYWKAGKTQTLDSYHLPQSDGYSHALDFHVIINGSITWDTKYYRPVMQAFATAAIELGVQVEFGGLWRTFIDAVHVQLNRGYY